MFELTAANACDYLGRAARITELGGGVSNTVLLVESLIEPLVEPKDPRENGRMVLKQSLSKLRVEQDWFSERERIWREAAAMRALGPLLPPDSVPEVLFEDRPNCIFGMTAAPGQTWKSELLHGVCSPELGATAAEILAGMILATRGDPVFEREFGDQTVFDQLRIDPYYRTTAARHPDLAPRFDALIRDSSNRRCSLVHGDFSPKNLLVSNDSLTLIDFEVVHYGDPSFDAGFLLNHLLLKSFYRPDAWERYASVASGFWEPLRHRLGGLDWFERATLQHLGALMLARVDGKSPAEYINTEPSKQQVRAFARSLIVDPPSTVEEVWRRRAIL